MKRKLIAVIVASMAVVVYCSGYYSARKDHVLVRRLHTTYDVTGHPQTRFTIERGNFGPGRGGILVPTLEIDFCFLVFTPLRWLEGKVQTMKSSNQSLERTRASARVAQLERSAIHR